MKSLQNPRAALSVLLALLIVLGSVFCVPISVAAAEVSTAASGDFTTVFEVDTAEELAAAAAEINAADSGDFAIKITDSFTASSKYDIKKNKTTIYAEKESTITFEGPAQGFTVLDNATLTLGQNGSKSLTLKSIYYFLQTEEETIRYPKSDEPGFIHIWGKDAVCNLEDGVTLCDFKGENYLGGGVTVQSGTFNMNGGTIKNCGIYDGSVCYGGGVAVFSGGRFNMSGGTISECYALSDYVDSKPDGEYHPTAMGGGVMVSSGSVFEMTGGTIENNTATNFGGGVCVVQTFREYAEKEQFGFFNSRVEISGGTISGNKAKSGAGIFASGIHITYFSENASGIIDETGYNEKPGVDIQGGNITGNIASENGGGIYFDEIDPSIVTSVKNATISENKAVNGAGICIYKYWTQTDIDNCTIKDNVASSSGGGIYIQENRDKGTKGTHVKDTTITGNKSEERGAGVYYDDKSKLTLSGKNIIQNNTYNEKLNNLNVYSVDNPVYIDGDLTGSEIGLSDPTLWDDEKDDTATDAVSTIRLTDGYKANNSALIPENAFTSDHESWYVDYGNRTETTIVAGESYYSYTGKKYPVLSRTSTNISCTGEMYSVKANTFTSGIATNPTLFKEEVLSRFQTNKYENYGDQVDANNMHWYYFLNVESDEMVYVVFTNQYNAQILPNGKAVLKTSTGHQNYYANSGEFVYEYASKATNDDLVYSTNYETQEIRYTDALTSDKTVYDYDELGHIISKTEISKSTENLVGGETTTIIDYTNEVRLVRKDQPIRFHDNKNSVNKGEDKLFRVYNAEDGLYDLVNYRVPEFYDIPSFAGDEYVFAGWYYNTSDGTADGDEPFEFDSALPANVTDVYAHWIPVGTVAQDAADDKVLPDGASYSGFGLFGVQIRPEYHHDSNYGEGKPGGLRFVASVGEELLGKIDSLSEKTVNGNKVEYGFVTAAESTVNTVIKKFNENTPGLIDSSKYKLQYNGENVNGVNTTVRGYKADNFNYVTNVDCTSKVNGYSTAGVKEDHRNFDGYRLATYVVTYDDDASGENKTQNVVARAYMRYYDANGLLRTFYNDYSGTNTYGGCSISYNSAKALSATNEKTVKN